MFDKEGAKSRTNLGFLRAVTEFNTKDLTNINENTRKELLKKLKEGTITVR